MDIFGAKMIDEGQKEQAAFIAKVYQTVDETIRFIAGNTASDGEVLKPDVVDKPCGRIDTKFEKFTATGAIEAGLIEAVQRGDCVVNGRYRLSKDGYLELGQKNFVFIDKSGGLRVGRFADRYQLMNFCKEFTAYESLRRVYSL